MGQYHLTINLDRREYLDPHDLGTGLKLWEQIPWAFGPMTALGLLLISSNGRGGGDFFNSWDGKNILSTETMALIGRWAGDRIAIVGDYAEDGDLHREHDDASKLYGYCRSGEYTDEEVKQYFPDESLEQFRANAITNISPLVRNMMTELFGLEYLGDGWLQVRVPEDLRSEASIHHVYGEDRVPA